MNDATLESFRAIADQMMGPEPRDWNFEGPYISTRYYGITRAKAEELAGKFGGKMWRDNDPATTTIFPKGGKS